MTATDDEIRDELRRRAEEGGPADALRERVRVHLNEIDTSEPFRPRPQLLVAASVAVMLIGLGAALLALGAFDAASEDVSQPAADSASPGVTQSPVDQPATTERSIADPVGSQGVPTTAAGPPPGRSISTIPTVRADEEPADGVRQISSNALRTPILFDVPADEDRFVGGADTANVFEVSLDGPITVSPPRVPIVRIIVPDDPITAPEIEAALGGPHVDTVVVDVGDSQLGGLDSRRIRLESDRGTTAVGFDLVGDVFVAADGIDRDYDVHVLQTDGDPIIVWIDAPSDRMDQARADASMIVESLRIVAD